VATLAFRRGRPIAIRFGHRLQSHRQFIAHRTSFVTSIGIGFFVG
jgi:hypothetical protein